MIDAGDYEGLDELEVRIQIVYSLKYNIQEKYMLIENKNKVNNFIGEFEFYDLKIAVRLIQDIKENYEKGTEFYNVETKIKQFIEENEK